MKSYIHEQADWPRLRFDESRLLPLLGQVRHFQGRLLGKMSGLGFRICSETSLSNLTADVLKSNAIEGNRLDADEVRSSIARRLGMDVAGTPPASRDVEGVVEMMLDATQNYARALTKERLFGWHACLFPSGLSGLQRIAVGRWRPPEAGPMQVVSGPIGRECIHYEAPAAVRLEGEMSAFLEWFSRSTDDPVLRAGIAHFWFVTIHPFEDGNGRIARAIADMALAQADGMPERFYSMSTRIEKERKDYYAVLEKCQKGSLDITAWLDWFLGCLGRAIMDAEKNIESALRKGAYRTFLLQTDINSRQRKVLDLLVEGFSGKLTSSKYAKIAKCSADTALRDIKDLLSRDLLTQEKAGGRSTAYTLQSSSLKNKNLRPN
jgi:Fic family protein